VVEGLDKDLEDKIAKIAERGFAQVEAEKHTDELEVILTTSLFAVLSGFDKLIELYKDLSGLKCANELYLNVYKDDPNKQEIADNNKEVTLRIKILEIEMVRRMVAEDPSLVNTEFTNSVLGKESTNG
jgi:hypothetical protein